MYYSLEFNEWTEATIEEGVLQEQILCKMVVLQCVKLFLLSKSLKKIPVKKLNFSKVADL